MTTQKVAGALVKGGMTQVKANEWYGTGFYVRSFDFHGTKAVGVMGRSSRNKDVRHLTVQAAKILIEAGLNVALTKKVEEWYTSLNLEVFDADVDHARINQITPEEGTKIIEDSLRTARNRKLTAEIETKEKQLAELQQEIADLKAQLAV